MEIQHWSGCLKRIPVIINSPGTICQMGQRPGASIVVSNMNGAENSMLETIKQLEIVLSKVYKKEIHPAT
jgi:hypothetical protein